MGLSNGEKTKNTCLVIPTHNNEEYIGKVLEKTTGFAGRVIVVDSSSDSTPTIVKRFHPRVKLLIGRKGKGNQLRQGISEALKQDSEFITLMDGDGEKTAADIPQLVEMLAKENADLCIGFRDKMRSRKRTVFNLISRFWINYLTSYGLKDPQSGFIVAKKSALKKLKLKAENFEIETEIVLEAFRNNLKITQGRIKVPKISPSKCTRKHMAEINNFFDCWVLENLKGTKIGLGKKLFLVSACFFGLICGKTLEKIS